MAYVLDGIDLALPLQDQQIIALAQKHRKQLYEALFHQEIHLGHYAFKLRSHVAEFIQQLPKDDQRKFYQVYDAELKRGAEEDHLHPAYAEEGVSIFAAMVSLVVIFGILYFAVIRVVMA